LLVASICFVVGYLRLRRRAGAGERRLLKISLLALAILFFVGAGEEISWGQRFLGIETPEKIREASAQGELNFHNLEMWSGAVDADRLFQLFWLSFGVLVPVLCACSRSLRRLLGHALPIMPLIVSAALVINQLLDSLAHQYFEGRYYNADYPFSHSLFETKESVTSVILAVGALYVVSQLRGGSADALEVEPGTSLRTRLSKPARRGAIEHRPPVGV
jgi:hypothetical protein